METRSSRVSAVAPAWRSMSALRLAESVRAVGLRDIVVAPRDGTIDWTEIRSIAEGGPTWVGGVFSISDAAQLPWSGAAGGIFHLGGDLLTTREGSPWSTLRHRTPGARDDENENQLNRDE